MKLVKKIGLKLMLLLTILLGMNEVYTRYFFQNDLKNHTKIIELVREIPNSTTILYIGESSNQTFSSTDVDQRKISEFLGDYFPSLIVEDITKPASHAGIYKTLLANIPQKSQVKTVVVTLNLRSFNAQWIYSELESALQKEMVLLKPSPPLYNRFLLSFKGYNHNTESENEAKIKASWKNEKLTFPYKFAFDNVKDWDHWLVHEGMKDKNGDINIPRKNLASHYLKAYALQIDTLTNPRIKDLDEIVLLAKKRGWNLVFNLLAENMDKAQELVGKDLVFLMNQNKQLLINYYTRKGVVVVDNLNSVRDVDFIDQDWTTEHYTELGRKTVAQKVANSIRKFHNEAFEKPTFTDLSSSFFFNNCDDQRNVWANMHTRSNLKSYSGKFSSKVGGSQLYSIALKYPLRQLSDSLKNGIIVDFKFLKTSSLSKPKLVIELVKNKKTINWLGIDLEGKRDSLADWQSIHYEFNLQRYLKQADFIKVFVANEHKEPCFVDDFRVEFE